MTLSKIKILVDAHVFDHSFQGSGTYLHGLYSKLVAFQDIEITICSYDINKVKGYFTDKRFQFIQLKTNSRFKRIFFEYPKIIQIGKFDYAHFTYIVPFSKKCKYILTIHDLLFLKFKEYFPWSYRIVRKYIFYISAKKADILLTVSSYSKNTLANTFKINPDKIYITPNAVTLYKPEKVNIFNKFFLRDYILYVSRFEPRKNHLNLLNCYFDLNLHDKYDLVFIGNKSRKIEWKAYCEVLKHIPDSIKNHVKFFENINQNDLIGFFQNAACSVYPSFAEGFGITPIEAAVNGSKVLCSNQTALADFDFFKYHFDPNDNFAFKTQLDEILKDENYPYDEIKAQIMKRYNWDTVAKNYYSIVQKNLISL